MIEISAQAQVLLGSDAVAHVWTNNPDGTPQVSVVWLIARGDEILFGTDAKVRRLGTSRVTTASSCRSRTSNGMSAASNAIWCCAAAPRSIPDLTRC